MSIMIELSGTPDAGKTTSLHSLFEVCKKNRYNTILLEEANGKTLLPHNLRGTLAFNEWIGTNACEGILKAKEKNPDIILVDRGFLDFRFWNYFYEKTGKATHQEVKDVQSKSNFTNMGLVPDLFVAVTVSTEEALRRNPSLSRKIDWVNEHNFLFNQFYGTYKGPKEQLDTTDLTREETLSSIIETINQRFPRLHLSEEVKREQPEER